MYQHALEFWIGHAHILSTSPPKIYPVGAALAMSRLVSVLLLIPPAHGLVPSRAHRHRAPTTMAADSGRRLGRASGNSELLAGVLAAYVLAAPAGLGGPPGAPSRALAADDDPNAALYAKKPRKIEFGRIQRTAPPACSTQWCAEKPPTPRVSVPAPEIIAPVPQMAVPPPETVAPAQVAVPDVPSAPPPPVETPPPGPAPAARPRRRPPPRPNQMTPLPAAPTFEAPATPKFETPAETRKLELPAELRRCPSSPPDRCRHCQSSRCRPRCRRCSCRPTCLRCPSSKCRPTSPSLRCPRLICRRFRKST